MSPYDVLGVAPYATDDEVRRAFRRFAQRNHPDRGGDPVRFQQGVDAYHRILGGDIDGGRAPGNVVFHRRPKAWEQPLRAWEQLVKWRRPRDRRVL